MIDFKTYGYEHIISKQKKFAVDHLAQLENTAFDENSRCREQFGMARRLHIVSKKNHELFYVNGILNRHIQGMTHKLSLTIRYQCDTYVPNDHVIFSAHEKNENWPKWRHLRLHKFQIGSKIEDKEKEQRKQREQHYGTYLFIWPIFDVHIDFKLISQFFKNCPWFWIFKNFQDSTLTMKIYWNPRNAT